METDFLQNTDAITKGYSGEEMILEADGIVYRGPDAWLKLLSIAPRPLRWLSWTGRFAVTRWLNQVGYRLVARFRYVLFGRKTCPLPNRSK